MAEITTLLTNATELLPSGLVCVRFISSSSDTWVCPYFQEIIACIGNNETDKDGVGIAVSGQTITVTADASDKISLLISGRG